MVQYPVPVRNLDAQAFRSRPMAEYVRFHGFLDQFIFRSKLRFQSHLRLLAEATTVLSEEFYRANRGLEKDDEQTQRNLEELDQYFHDMDRIAKETLLAFRAELACLPDSSLNEIMLEIETLIGRRASKPLVLVSQ